MGFPLRGGAFGGRGIRPFRSFSVVLTYVLLPCFNKSMLLKKNTIHSKIIYYLKNY